MQLIEPLCCATDSQSLHADGERRQGSCCLESVHWDGQIYEGCTAAEKVRDRLTHNKTRAILPSPTIWGRQLKFQEVPDPLAEKVRETSNAFDASERESIYLNAAGWVIAWYLEMDVTKEFYVPAVSYKGALWHKHANSVILVAETLFRMRREPGFKEICRRLKGRDFRSTLFEMLSAKQFLKAGYKIHAKPETGIRGQDFDFSAVSERGPINVEVTALTASTYSRTTVLSALGKKRSQLPNDAPSVIFCALPDEWTKEPADWSFRLMSIAYEFLRGTRRVNVVHFWSEHTFDLWGGPAGGLVYAGHPYVNVAPYFPMSTDVFFRGRYGSTGEFADLDDATVGAMMKSANATEFFRWVDALVP